MPDELNNRMDKMLRDYAQERRKSPENPIHPATRRMLQGEVARVYKNAPATGLLPRLANYWHYIALGAAVCLVLGVLLWPRSSQSTFEMASREPGAPRVTPRLESAPGDGAALPTSAGTRVTPQQQADSELPQPEAALEDASASTLAPPVGDPASTTETEYVRRQFTTPSEIRDAVAPSEQNVAFSPREGAELKAEELVGRAPRPATAATTGEAIQLTNLGAALRTTFARVTNATELTNTAPVLNRFQLEQLGGQLRFIDFDGSFYDGTIVPSEEATPAQSGAPENSIVTYFEAKGTNRTLGENIVVTGSLVERTNTPLYSDETFTFERSSAARARRILPDAPKRSILGWTVIGGTNELPFEAVSTNP